jgi:hypothetical protein
MFVAGAGYILVIGSLLGMTTVSPRPVHELTVELGESTVLAVETAPALVAGCEPITIS